MADLDKRTDGPAPGSDIGYDFTQLPDYDNDFIDEKGIVEFVKALSAPENSPSQEDLTSPEYNAQHPLFITALNDWRPVRQKVRRRKRGKPRRGKDETREGFVYGLLKWPMLVFVLGWIIVLGISYLLTRVYISAYEQLVTWRGKRERLRRSLRSQTSYSDWIKAAEELDTHLGNDKWKKIDDYAYYDSKTIDRVTKYMRTYRKEAEAEEHQPSLNNMLTDQKPIDELRGLVEACVKNNFVGFENPRLYSETYYGTKDLVQSFVDEVEASLSLLNRTKQLDIESKRALFKHLQTNFGRTALCLSGGATFAYYHFGVAKALLDADLLPDVITGTSGGALVAALLATRTNEELKKLLVPALAHRITACHDDWYTWVRRWWRTGARFDSVDWARRGSWFTRGNTTFREAYERTGRILNVSCVPSDPHSPTILANYLTSPDCVIWSAIMASAAVPGILNPVVLMKKNKNGKLEPYSFGHKWKDGSLRTDIPLKALNLHFNVNFSIVSQVNPHVNLFFFSSRGTVGRPVTHRRGRGWRGGFLGSAIEQFLKLDLTKWLKVLRHLELLPRPLGQDWSNIWLQRFSGTITIWPKSIPSDFYYILSDPSPQRLARMIRVGQLSTWPKLKFIANRMKIERLVESGRKSTRIRPADGSIAQILSEDDLRGFLREAERNNGFVAPRPFSGSEDSDSEVETMRIPSNALANKPLPTPPVEHADGNQSPTLSTRLSNWWNRSMVSLASQDRPTSMYEMRPKATRRAYEQVSSAHRRRGSLVSELSRQSRVFFDDDDFDAEDSADGEESNREAFRDGNGWQMFSDEEGRDDESVVDSEGEEEDAATESPQEMRLEDRAVQRDERPTFVGFQLFQHQNQNAASKPLEPPVIPYSTPFLGSALSFLSKTPFKFWKKLRSTESQSLGACTLLLGGQTTHILFDPGAVQALFKARGPSRDKFNQQLFVNCLAVSKAEYDKFYGVGEKPKFDENGKPCGAKEQQENMAHDFLLRTEAVAELTREFTRRLKEYMAADKNIDESKGLEIGIVKWLWPLMFKASATALFGSRILEVYPDLPQDFALFDSAFLTLFFGFPDVLVQKEKKAFQACMAGMIRWQKTMQEECKHAPVDPHGSVSWEPIFGSRLNRARQRYYADCGLETYTRAASDLGLIFGLASNAIPATCWMLMHILDPNADEALLTRVMAEIQSARSANGQLDFGVLSGLPLLQSILHEVLRLYTDVLVTRDNKDDLVLPFSDGQRRMVFRKGDVIMAPTGLQHYNEQFWSGPPCDQFYAERFLKTDPTSGKAAFSLTGTAGKFFPFGGGKTICPGRVFAKQEVLGAVAITLLEFEVEGLSYVDERGSPTDKFPGVRRGFSGAGVVPVGGDLITRLRRRG